MRRADGRVDWLLVAFSFGLVAFMAVVLVGMAVALEARHDPERAGRVEWCPDRPGTQGCR